MQSPHDHVIRLQNKLEKEYARKKPLFPTAYAKKIEKLERELTYWRTLEKQGDKTAMMDFGEATGLDTLLAAPPGAAVSQTAPAPQIITQRVAAASEPLWTNPVVLGAGGLLVAAVAWSMLREE